MLAKNRPIWSPCFLTLYCGFDSPRTKNYSIWKVFFVIYLLRMHAITII
jgi:hypothetical protein